MREGVGAACGSSSACKSQSGGRWLQVLESSRMFDPLVQLLESSRMSDPLMQVLESSHVMDALLCVTR